MIDKHKDSGRSRRRFLNLGFLFGLGLLTSSKTQARTRALKTEGGEKARLITADGQILEVDKKHIPNFGRAKPVSDSELLQWKEAHRK